MRKIRQAVLIYAGTVAVIFMAGCAVTTPSKIESVWNPAAKNLSLKTYGWDTRAIADIFKSKEDNAAFNNAIHQAINQALTSKGYQKQTGTAGDFLVAYKITGVGDISFTTITTPYYTNPGSRPISRANRNLGAVSAMGFPYGQTYAEKSQKGTLLLTFLEPKTKKMIWQGSATNAVDASLAVSTQEESAAAAIRKILSNFPVTSVPVKSPQAGQPSES